MEQHYHNAMLTALLHKGISDPADEEKTKKRRAKAKAAKKARRNNRAK